MTELKLPRPVVTVATIVMRDGAFLCVEEEARGGVRLNQPAGHVEVGESIAAAAARETLEEAAWRVDPTALVGVYHWQSPLRHLRTLHVRRDAAHARVRPSARHRNRPRALAYLR